MIRIIGVGTWFGDDGAGLAAAARLAARRPPDVDVILTDRPGLELLEQLTGAEAVIVIDAVRSGAVPGTLHDLDLHSVMRSRRAALSSHGLGVAEALALGAALGRLPARGRLIGVEAGCGPSAALGGVSGAVERGLDAAVARARAWAERYRGETMSGDV